MTTVTNQSLLECRFRDDSGSLEMDLKISGTWTLTDGDVTDEITASSTISDVTTRFQPESGYEQRMRFKPNGGTWGSWSSWTTGRIAHDMKVPGSGKEVTDHFEVEMRLTGGTALSMSGYIKVRKINP